MAATYKPILEICVDSYQDAMVAVRGGADRLEVCADLQLDGLTPDYEMVARITDHSDLPVMVMIRCRSGNFCYTEEEMEQMLIQMDKFLSLDIHGFVFGCVTLLDQIDIKNTKILLEKAGSKQTTFHRAFDHVSDKTGALSQLIKLGVDSVLTSGCIGPAIYGLEVLVELTDLANDQIDIIVGGGVTPENIATILSKVSPSAFHASLNVSSGQYDGMEKILRLKKAI